MVKQTKTFKKGNVTKKALSAILAASMVMTSSSFVMAAPVEVEDVAVEAAAEVAVGAEETADVVEETEATDEEQVGVAYDHIKVFVTGTYTYTGEEIKPTVTVTAYENASEATGSHELNSNDYTVTYSNNINAGTAKVTVTPASGIAVASTSPIEATFKIEQLELNTGNTIVAYDDVIFTYNGKVQTPAIKSVKVAGKELDVNLFKVVGKETADNLKDAKPQTVKLAVKDANGNYSVSSAPSTKGKVVGESTYQIAKAEFNKDNISATAKKVEIGKLQGNDKEEIKSYLTVVNSAGEKLTTSDYAVVGLYDANGNAMTDAVNLEKGIYTVELQAAGNNYTGTSKVSTTLEVVDRTLETLVKNNFTGITVNNTQYTFANKLLEKVDDADAAFTYNGKERKITAVTINGLDASNYTVETVEAKDVGTYNVVVKGKGVYGGQEATVVVKITPMQITAPVRKDTFASDSEPFTCIAKLGKTASGVQSDNAFFVLKRKASSGETGDYVDSYNYVTLKEGVDYTYTLDKTKGDVVITGIGNFTTENKNTGEKTVSVKYKTFETIFLSEPTITATVSGTYTYTGTQVTPQASAVTVTDNGVTLKYGIDYTLAYGANNTTGTGKIYVNPGSNRVYSGQKVIEFQIHGQDIAEKFAIKEIKDVQLKDAKDGNGCKEVSVVYKNASTATLPPKDNYDVTYSRDGKVIATKKGNADVSVKDENAFKKTGKIDVEVTGKGQYEGTLKTSYNIVGTDIATQIEVEDIADQTYTGTAVEPAVKVTTKTGVTKYFVKDKDYTVTYKNNVEAGVAYAVVTGIGDYSGEIVKSFKIVGDMDQTIEVLAAQERDLGNGSRTLNSKATKIKYTAKTAVTFESSNPDVVTVDAEGNVKYTGLGEATITIKAAAENGYKEATKELKVVVKLAKPSFTPFSKNNAFTLTSSTVKGAEKFEVQYATKKDFSNKKSVKFTATSGKVRQVKVSAADKKTYYVRVRAISGTETSAWSATKTVATK